MLGKAVMCFMCFILCMLTFHWVASQYDIHNYTISAGVEALVTVFSLKYGTAKNNTTVT